MRLKLEMPQYRGIDSMLEALTLTLKRERTNPNFQALARELTAPPERARRDKMSLIISELHRRFTYARDPLSETLTVPFTLNGTVDADDACLFVAALAVNAGIPCRFVLAEIQRRSWTCFVSYQLENGDWEIVDPLRQSQFLTGPNLKESP